MNTAIAVNHRPAWPWIVLVAGAVWAAAPVLAAEDGGESWRATYDVVMRWVNFLILAGLIYKYLRRPLMLFLKGEKDKIKAELQDLETAKAAADDSLRRVEEQLASDAQRLVRSRELMMAAAQKRRDQIIAEARRHGQLILEAGQRAIEGQIHEAKARLRVEMVDAAMAIVDQRLPLEMTEQDQKELTRRYIEGI
jgi:F-type H+-transporting ATPase subunit b